MQEMWVRLLNQEDPLEKVSGIAGIQYHSSITAWKIPSTEELGKLKSMGSQESQDLVTKQQQQM